LPAFVPRSLITSGLALFDMEFANGEFTESEKMKIMTNERLAEIALTKRCASISWYHV
jgi:hypothetical protein